MEIESKPGEFTQESTNIHSRDVCRHDCNDIQGIPWNTSAMNISRRNLRIRRLRTYHAYRSCPIPEENFVDNTLYNDCPFFEFNANHPQAECCYKHFQLRNCVQYTNDNEILYLSRGNSIFSFNPFSRKTRKIKSSAVDIVSYHSWNNYLVCGGLEGELQISDLEGNTIKDIIIADEDSTKITNHCEFFNDGNGVKVMACNNDKKVRIMDPNTLETQLQFEFIACVNKAAISYDYSLIAAALDDEDVYIQDYRTGQMTHKLTGHKDYTFGVAWHPNNGNILATGNQDGVGMIWDIRKGTEVQPLHTLCGFMGSVLNLAFSENGEFMAFSESGDFVSIYDTRSFDERQVIDGFGEISGICFTKEPNSLYFYIGYADDSFNSLLELRKKESDLDF